MYTVYFLVYTNYNFKISVIDGVELFFKMSMFMIAKELSYTVRCTELLETDLELLADLELVGNYLSDQEKTPSLRMGLLDSYQLHLKVKGHFQSVLERGIFFCDQSSYCAL